MFLKRYMIWLSSLQQNWPPGIGVMAWEKRLKARTHDATFFATSRATQLCFHPYCLGNTAAIELDPKPATQDGLKVQNCVTRSVSGNVELYVGTLTVGVGLTYLENLQDYDGMMVLARNTDLVITKLITTKRCKNWLDITTCDGHCKQTNQRTNANDRNSVN